MGSGITVAVTPSTGGQHLTPAVDMVPCSEQGNTPGSEHDDVPLPKPLVLIE